MASLQLARNFSRSSFSLLPILPAILRPTPISLQWPASTEPSVLNGSLISSFPSFLTDIWESILQAVPKKKTSHMKRRHRQMAGKALKDVTNLKPCPSCGQPKRPHVLCASCVKAIKEKWKTLAPF
ncbi:uncharacterized protein TRUGW13939_03556 [Talaromyces rugulosus]|uniref:Large ribosomal subunit protein bL32m n=1 Tax=Talaromyces rugulosus TaxID=121627 RepID=A0A7H8QSJ0_TALRU|nr:uncharacterized protein TRUGW13939_03556 [Talaromyces rugulosus]QKX56451.1 hypothetical protein TRUGW13939_03556 [Talaromyces rugulosus]